MKTPTFENLLVMLERNRMKFIRVGSLAVALRGFHRTWGYRKKDLEENP
jgi:hypothetical protein